MEAFWSKPSVKRCDKQWRSGYAQVKYYYDLLDQVRAKWLETDKKLVPVWEKSLTRRFVGPSSSRGGRRLQRSTSATVNGDRSTSSLCQRPAYGTGWQRSRRCSTTQHLADGQSRLKREENYEVVRTSPRAFTRLQSLQLVTLMFTEQANNLYIVVYWVIVWLSFILQKNIGKILDSFVRLS